MAHNQLVRLGAETLGLAPRLHTLDASHNRLDQVELEQLPRLHTLFLSYNLLTIVPRYIKYMVVYRYKIIRSFLYSFLQCCDSGITYSGSGYEFLDLTIRILPMLFKHFWKL